MDVLVGTMGFVGMISVMGLFDIMIDKYQYRAELGGF